MALFILLLMKLTKTDKALNTNLLLRISLELNGKCETTIDIQWRPYVVCGFLCADFHEIQNQIFFNFSPTEFYHLK